MRTPNSKRTLGVLFFVTFYSISCLHAQQLSLSLLERCTLHQDTAKAVLIQSGWKTVSPTNGNHTYQWKQQDSVISELSVKYPTSGKFHLLVSSTDEHVFNLVHNAVQAESFILKEQFEAPNGSVYSMYHAGKFYIHLSKIQSTPTMFLIELENSKK